MLAAADRQDRDEETEREARAEAFANRCLTTAPLAYEQLDLMRARADAEAARAEVTEQRIREERLAEQADYRASLIVSGRRPRTVAEILADAALFS